MIICPLSTIYNVSKNGKEYAFRLNLNVYRNTHHSILGKAKLSYKRELLALNPHIKTLRYDKPVSLYFVLYKPSSRRIDRANICAIVEKFACDVLTECGVWDDDNDEHIISTTYITGGVDRENPRIELNIK